MVLVKSYTLQEILIKVNFRIIRRKEKENSFLKMGLFIKEILKMICFKAKE